MSFVTVYNLGASETLGRVSLKQAIRMVHRGVARIQTVDSDSEADRYAPYEGRPKAVELIRYIFAKWMYNRTNQTYFSKSGVLRRDEYHCAYCPQKATTVDHVLPRALGGTSTWENCVAACWDCNQKKADKLLENSGLKLLRKPFIPTVSQAYGR